jgi:hypothetical protein
MGKKPKNASESSMVKNAKKKKKSKNVYVNYPDIDGIKSLLGINVSDTEKKMKHNISNSDLKYLKPKNKILKEIVLDLEKELLEKEPDEDKLMAYSDDIYILGQELNLDMNIVNRVCSEIDNIIR